MNHNNNQDISKVFSSSSEKRIQVVLNHLIYFESHEALREEIDNEPQNIHNHLLSLTQSQNSFPLREPELFRGWVSQPNEHEYFLDVVEGSIPLDLKGTLYRNGPGLLEVYGTPLIHPIDGDGLVCSVSFDGSGKAYFRSKFVKTTGYTKEKANKKMIMRGLMGSAPSGESQRGLYKNPSNTNVYFWGGKLLAVWESGLPYHLNPITLDTLGKDHLNFSLKDSKCLAAHFRYDPKHHRLVTFSFRVGVGKSSIWFYEYDEKWNIISSSTYELEDYYYCHDFLLTPNYYIVHQSPFYCYNEENFSKLLSGDISPGELIRYYPNVPSNFILIPRINPNSNSQNLKYFTTEPCHIYHHSNAYEEGDNIYFSSVCLPTNFNMSWDKKYWLSNVSVAPGKLYDYILNLKNNKASRLNREPSSCEFPYSNPEKHGEKWRYSYLMAADAPHPYIPYQEIIKHDHLGDNRQVWSSRKERGVIGEPIYVPKKNNLGDKTSFGDEDEGWVITQLFKPDNQVTQFIILDAKKLSQGPIARLQLKTHIPYGFHGTFSSQVVDTIISSK